MVFLGTSTIWITRKTNRTLKGAVLFSIHQYLFGRINKPHVTYVSKSYFLYAIQQLPVGGRYQIQLNQKHGKICRSSRQIITWCDPTRRNNSFKSIQPTPTHFSLSPKAGFSTRNRNNRVPLLFEVVWTDPSRQR